MCKTFGVRGYPTFKYFSYYNKEQKDYDGGRLKDDFIGFMSDPSGATATPAPPVEGGEESWAGGKGSEHLLHLHDDDHVEKLASAEHSLVVYYAPWCGHCKNMKAPYAMAAQMLANNPELSGKSFKLMAVDATVQMKAASVVDITGYPTIKYFRAGKNPEEYSGGRSAQAFHDFLVEKITGKAVVTTPAPPVEGGEESWSDKKGSENLLHLHDDDHVEKLASAEHALVVYYAPWCGHCKNMKAPYATAALMLASNPELSGKSFKLMAVDATVQRKAASVVDISGYPTIKYFRAGKNPEDYRGGRTAKAFHDFLVEKITGKAAATTPAPPVEGGEESWSDKEGSEYLLHLHDKDYEAKLRSAEHALVVYYAPWCGHCKNMKADYAKAALMLANNRKLSGKSFTIAAVDATVQKKAASAMDIKGYPTIKYFRAGKNPEDYRGGRTAKDFHDFLVKKVTDAEKGRKTEL